MAGPRLRQFRGGRSLALAAVFQPGAQVNQVALEIFALLAPQAELFRTHGELALRDLRLAVQAAAGTMPLGKLVAQGVALCSSGRHQLQERVELVGGFLGNTRAVSGAILCGGDGQQPAPPLVAVPDQQLRFQVAPELLVLLGAPRLPLEVAQPGRQLIDDVSGTGEVAARIGKFLAGLVALALVNRDARGLFEKTPALLRPLRQRLINQALTDDAVGALAEAGTAQQLGDVAQTHAVAVEVVLILARTVGAASDLHLAEVDRQPARAVVQDERDVGHAHTRPLLAAREDHVLGALTAQRAVALLTQDPAEGVRDVRLTAPVRTDDGRHAAIEDEFGARGESFVTLEYKMLEETHGRIIPRAGRVRPF